MRTARDVVDAFYRSYEDQDLEAFLALCHPDIEWAINGPTELEQCQTFRGVEGVQRFLGIMDALWDLHLFQTCRVVADGDTVVVLGHEAGTGKRTGRPFKSRWAHVFDVADGRIVRFKEFMCQWVGEDEPPPMTW